MPLDCFSWLANANLAAFSCSLANLFSYLLTFFKVGLMNLPFMSETEMVSSLIWRSRRITSRCRKNISPSRPYHLSKYFWQMPLRSSMEEASISGKFIKPTLKKVSKYENKFAKLQEKAAKFAFANQLKQSK